MQSFEWEFADFLLTGFVVTYLFEYSKCIELYDCGGENTIKCQQEIIFIFIKSVLYVKALINNKVTVVESGYFIKKPPLSNITAEFVKLISRQFELQEFLSIKLVPLSNFQERNKYVSVLQEEW